MSNNNSDKTFSVSEILTLVAIASLLMGLVSLGGVIISLIMYSPNSIMDCYGKTNPTDCLNTCVCGWCSYPNCSVSGVCYPSKTQYCSSHVFLDNHPKSCDDRDHESFVVNMCTLLSFTFFVILGVGLLIISDKYFKEAHVTYTEADNEINNTPVTPAVQQVSANLENDHSSADESL